MSNIDIIRAWKDEEYRNSLTDEQRSQLPENPAGMIELSNDEMENIKGGRPNSYYCNTNTACGVNGCANFKTLDFACNPFNTNQSACTIVLC